MISQSYDGKILANSLSQLAAAVAAVQEFLGTSHRPHSRMCTKRLSKKFRRNFIRFGSSYISSGLKYPTKVNSPLQ
jgi:hypothetical protein